MTEDQPHKTEPATGEKYSDVRVTTDSKAMRALAHPVRLALLEAIHTEGEITATQAAEMLDESPGNMSWHLQTLAKYGFIEEAGGGKGRKRPWKIASVSHRFSTTEDDPGSHAAGQALEMTVFERSGHLLREWWSVEQSFSPEWREAAFMTDSISYLTAQELAELSEQINDLVGKYNERVDKKKRPEGALPVHLNTHGHPLPPRPADS
jgi:DNA-binding transcriptional ArsR family regulator